MTFLLWFIIACSIVGMIIGTYRALTNEYNILSNFEEGCFGAFLGLWGGFALSLMIAIIAHFIIVSNVEMESVKTWEVPLVALQDNTGHGGLFFLGSGTISGSLKYYGMYNDGNGGVRSLVLPASVTSIYEGNIPSAAEYKMKPRNRMFESITWFFSAGTYYTVTVPSGTIKYEFNVDLR